MTLRREDLEPPEGEIMVIEIRPNKCKKIALVLCYRSQDFTLHTFIHNVESALSRVSSNFDCLCCG